MRHTGGNFSHNLSAHRTVQELNVGALVRAAAMFGPIERCGARRSSGEGGGGEGRRRARALRSCSYFCA